MSKNWLERAIEGLGPHLRAAGRATGTPQGYPGEVTALDDAQDAQATVQRPRRNGKRGNWFVGPTGSPLFPPDAPYQPGPPSAYGVQDK